MKTKTHLASKSRKNQRKVDQKIFPKRIIKWFVGEDDTLPYQPASSLLQWLPGIFIFFISFKVYLATLTSTIALHDTGDMITSAYSLGIAHPPGYPLYALIGKLFCTLPIANIAFRLNLFSALAASTTVMLLYFIILKITPLPNETRTTDSYKIKKTVEWIKIIPPTIGALLFAFTRTFWQQATFAEKYTLNICFTTLLIYILLKWHETIKEEKHTNIARIIHSQSCLVETPSSSGNTDIAIIPCSRKYLSLFAFISGLSFTHHLQTIFIIPGSIFFIWGTLQIHCLNYSGKWHYLLWKFTEPLKNLLIFILPLSLYFYLPIRAAANPVVNWGNPNTFSRFLAHITARDYSHFFTISALDLVKRTYTHLTTFFTMQFTIWPILLIILGLILLFHNRRRFAIFMILIFLTNLFHSIRYGIHNIEDYYIPAFLICTIWAGYSILWIFSSLMKYRLALVRYLILIFVCIPAIPATANYYYANARLNFFSHDFASNVLLPLKEHAILYVKGDTFAFPIWYLRHVENIRNDVTLIDLYSFQYDWYIDEIKDQYPCLKFPPLFHIANEEPYALIKRRFDHIWKNNAQPIYLPYEKGYETDYTFVPEGISHRAMGKNTTRDDQFNQLLPLKFKYRGIYDNIYKEERVQNNIDNYAITYNIRGDFYTSGRYYPSAISEFKSAIKVKPDYVDARYNLALAYKEMGEYNDAKSILEGLTHKYPQNPRGYYGLGLLYQKKSDLDAACIAFKKALSLDPDRPFIHNNLGIVYTELKQYDEAMKEFKTTLQINSTDIEALYNLAVIYYLKGDKKLAVQTYKDLLKIDPYHKGAMDALVALGR